MLASDLKSVLSINKHVLFYTVVKIFIFLVIQNYMYPLFADWMTLSIHSSSLKVLTPTENTYLERLGALGMAREGNRFSRYPADCRDASVLFIRTWNIFKKLNNTVLYVLDFRFIFEKVNTCTRIPVRLNTLISWVLANVHQSHLFFGGHHNLFWKSGFKYHTFLTS